MPYPQAQIDALKAALAAGVKQVSFGDQSITYNSTEEMLTALRVMEAENAAATTRPRRYGVVTRKAF